MEVRGPPKGIREHRKVIEWQGWVTLGHLGLVQIRTSFVGTDIAWCHANDNYVKTCRFFYYLIILDASYFGLNPFPA